MPNLNVKGDAPKGGGGSASGGGIPKIVIIIAAAVVGLVAIAFILNTTGIVKLWGKKKAAPQVVAVPTEDFQPVTTDTTQTATEQPAVTDPSPSVTENLTKVESSARMPSARKAAPMPKNMVKGTGMYTVQISSWPSKDKANVMVKIFSDAGFDAFVEPMGSFYRVCVGRFETKADAKAQMDKMEHMLESRPVVARVGG